MILKVDSKGGTEGPDLYFYHDCYRWCEWKLDRQDDSKG